MPYGWVTKLCVWVMRFACCLVLVIFLIAYRLFAFDGYYGWDDMAYAEYAAQLINDSLSLTDPSHFVYRWGIIVPLAVCYQWLGINDISTTLPSLLATIGMLWLIYRLTRFADFYTAAIAMLLFALDYYTIFYAIRPYADVILSFFTLLLLAGLLPITRQRGNTAVLSGSYWRWEAAGFNGFARAFWVALCLMCCWVSKETALFVLPLLGLWAMYDVYYQKNRTFWIFTAFFTALLAGVYFAYIAAATGSWSYRFDRIAANYYFNSCSYHLLPFSALWHRLTIGLLQLLVANGMITSMMWAWIPLLSPFTSQWLDGQTSEIGNNEFYSPKLYAIIFAVLFFTYHYMSISYQHYIPLCLDGRHFLPLVPVGALASAPVLSAFFRYGRHGIAVCSSATVVACLSSAAGWGDKPMSAIYGAIAVLCWLRLLIFWYQQRGVVPMSSHFAPAIFGALLAALLALHPLYVMFRPTTTGYAVQTNLVRRYLLVNKERQLVVCDDLNENLGKYYTHFVEKPSTVFINYVDYCPDMLREGKFDQLYVLCNNYTNQNIEASGHSLPNYMRQILLGFETVADSGGIRLYRVHNITVMDTIYDAGKY